MGTLTPSQIILTQTDSAGGVAPAAVRRDALRRRTLTGAYAALLAFMFVYFARPEDWIPGLSSAPLAKITGILALVALACSIGQFRQRIPREVVLLCLLVGQLFAASLLSPVWSGGAMNLTLNFSKIVLVALLIIGTVTTSRRLRWVLFSQAVSSAAIAAVMLWKGRLLGGRLEGILDGNYADPNDLALALTLSLPICLALLFLSRRWFGKLFWSASMAVMAYVIFLTGSRGGFLALVTVTGICLWEFAIRGRRRYLLVLAALAGAVLWQHAGGTLAVRFQGTFDPEDTSTPAYASSQTRQQLFWRSVDVTEEHPLFGVGPGNFDQVSGQWHTTHNSLTLMSSEGGIPALVLYVMILWLGFKKLRATMRLAGRTRESSILARAVFASFAGYVVGSIFLSWAYQFLPYILVAYTTPLFSIVKESAARSKQTEPAHPAVTEECATLRVTGAELPLIPGFPES
jgi:O-antigen ligase